MCACTIATQAVRIFTCSNRPLLLFIDIGFTSAHVDQSRGSIDLRRAANSYPFPSFPVSSLVGLAGGFAYPGVAGSPPSVNVPLTLRDGLCMCDQQVRIPGYRFANMGSSLDLGLMAVKMYIHNGNDTWYTEN